MSNKHFNVFLMILSNRDICIEYCYCNTLVKTHRKKNYR